jgi:hypothetical protein
MCYQYFRMWLSFILRDGAQSPRFPTVPTLFLYGTKKRIMFHDERYDLAINLLCPLSFPLPPPPLLLQV